ncbi:MAG TPA: hypothetical protein PLE74_07105 [Candidatus Cloacimonadota bacterium]|nr:hypothetical protein [Candidatus Cloacimonadota bacterium]
MQTRKFFIVILLIVIGIASNCYAQSLYDDFSDYLVGSSLNGQGGWVHDYTGPDLTICDTFPLTYPNYNGGNGNYIEIPYSPNYLVSREKIILDQIPTDGSTIYYSFLLRLSSVGLNNHQYFIYLCDSLSDYYAKLFAKPISSGYCLTVTKYTVNDTYRLSPTVLDYDTTYLILVRYSFGFFNSNYPINDPRRHIKDSCELWINPSLSSEEPDFRTVEYCDTTSSEIINPSQDSDIFTSIPFCWQIRNRLSPVGSLDGLRIAFGSSHEQAWENLNATNYAPIPDAPANICVTQSGNNTQIAWSASEGATDYKIMYSANPNGIFQFLSTTNGATTYIDTTAGVCLKRFYRVVALR